MSKPAVLILHATGTNRDREAAWAIEKAGGQAEIVHVNALASGDCDLQRYRMLVLPGGFSYGDDLGAGRLWALDLLHRLKEQVQAFTARGRPVLGICNGFQALVKSGLLLGNAGGSEQGPAATLTRNASGHFECRWVWLQPQTDSHCIFTQGLQEMIYCPVAHGEGNFVVRNEDTLATLKSQRQIALTYTHPNGGEAVYPWNPNGSVAHIAGICDATGLIMGLMPHPEDHIAPEQRPDVAHGGHGYLGLPLWINGVRYAAQV